MATDRRQMSEVSRSPHFEMEQLVQAAPASKRRNFCSFMNIYKALILALLLVIAVTFIIMTSQSIHSDSVYSATSMVQSSNLRASDVFDGNVGGKQFYLYRVERTEQGAKAIQDCHGSQLKQSFPDLDYALLGYNILHGYPLAIGHDPGFTLPIFKADYTKEHYSQDCRYSIPEGLTVIPDISCITSFESKVVQNSYEFSNSLSFSAQVSGGGWGVKFSASAGYKQSAATMASGESLFILSEAKCNYYFSKLNSIHLPPLDDDLIAYVKILQDQDDEQSYIDFFSNYGTHFASYVVFGARYVHQHKMSMSSYKHDQQKGVDVAASASYSGLFSVGGGFNMDTSQREAASNFQKSVTTTTITVGASPPADGDAARWASTVKDSPVPTQYKLESIEDLFTAKYMTGYGVDFTKIRPNIMKYKERYCLNLLANGDVDSCAPLEPGIRLEKTAFRVIPFNGKKYSDVSLATCTNLCLQNPQCIVLDNYGNQCYLNYQSPHPYIASSNYDSILFTTKVMISNQDLVMFKTAVDPNVPMRKNGDGLSEKASKIDQCRAACVSDHICFAYMFCESCQSGVKCILYTEENIKTLKSPLRPSDDAHKTVILNRNVNSN